ncbi:MAG: hypothetical protein B6244_02010 [Candidatus Cloacimonetes bacterium 4572_55]|nr:MAG: hypothetical protein B6244_02010 [Candidatus Cloacimonetes bacterium 4572_55]
MFKKNILILLFLFLISLVPFEFAIAIDGAQVAIYSGEGAWSHGVIAFENFLDWKDITHEAIDADDINLHDLREYYDAIYFPGGYAYDFKISINGVGRRHIRDLVNDGGAYIGICAGAYYASDQVDWEGVVYNYPLNLFQGTAVGAIDSIEPWSGYDMTTVWMNQDNPINQYEPPVEIMLYYGGPAFYPHEGVSVDTVATWVEYDSHSAIINFTYGEGRVLLIGPHPEIEEDSDRDDTSFADELNDGGSDWNFLWPALDWVLGWEISNPSPISITPEQIITTSKTCSLLQNYPNPFNPITTIIFEIPKTSEVYMEIYDVSGKFVRNLVDKPMEIGYHSVVWDGVDEQGKDVSSGIYFYKIEAGKFENTKKMVLLR